MLLRLLQFTSLIFVLAGIVWAQPARQLSREALTVNPSVLGIERPQRSITAGQATAVQANATSLTLRPGEFVTGRTREAIKEATVATGTIYTLPYRMVGTTRAGKKVDLTVDVEIGGGGFRFDPALGAFVGSLFVGLRDQLDPEASSPLGRTVSLLVTAAADSVTPTTVTRTQTNQFGDVRIVARSPSESVAVRIRPDFDVDGVELSIPVQRPALSIEVSPPSIQGFGLETADVTVSAPSANGSVTVRLSSSGARPDPPVLTLDESGTATASVRSRGLGSATLTAGSEIFQPATATIDFVPPWGFAIAAILGGIIGGFIRFLMPLLGNRKKPRPRELTIQVALGILAGVLTAAAYAVGLNFLNVSPTAVVGEALVFTVAALGALAGGTLFTRSLAGADDVS